MGIIQILSLHSFAIVVTICAKPCDIIIERGAKCVMTAEVRRTWDEAQSYCGALGGHLASVVEDDTQAKLNELADTRGWEDYWLGGQLDEDNDWFWLLGQQKTLEQGCYRDETRQHDLPRYAQTSRNMTPEECRYICANEQYPYASVQIRHSVVMCRCGKHYGMYGAMAWSHCATPCPYSHANPGVTVFCGAHKAQFVYKVDGSVGTLWGDYGQQIGPGNCAALTPALAFKLTVHQCNSRLSHLCQYAVPRDTCKAVHNRHWLVKHCVSFHVMSYTWYQARAHCLQTGGDLLTLDSQKLYQTLKAHLIHRGHAWWVGLTNRHWKWRPSNRNILQNLWYDGYPQYNMGNQRCLTSVSNTSFHWRNAACENKKFFMCEIPVRRHEDSNFVKEWSPWFDPSKSYNDDALHSSPTMLLPMERESSSAKLGIGIGIGVAVGMLIVLFIIILILCYKRRSDDSFPGRREITDTNSTSSLHIYDDIAPTSADYAQPMNILQADVHSTDDNNLGVYECVDSMASGSYEEVTDESRRHWCASIPSDSSDPTYQDILTTSKDCTVRDKGQSLDGISGTSSKRCWDTYMEVIADSPMTQITSF